MVVQYITNDNTIIFGIEYNEPLNPELISNYKKIIFSEYELNNELFDAYKNDNWQNWKYRANINIWRGFNYPLGNSLKNCFALTHINFSSIFNQPLYNCFDNCTALTHIVFGNWFNCPLAHSFDNCISLTHIVFGYWFNCPLVHSFDNCTFLTHITFDYSFNCPLAHSFDNCIALTHITFGYSFNCPLGNSLDNCIALTHITFGYSFNCPPGNVLDNFPFLTHIGLGYNFNQKLELPSNIKSLMLNCDNGSFIDHLPDTIEELNFGIKFNFGLNNLPSSIKKIIFKKYGYEFTYKKKLNCLPDGLSILELPELYEHRIENIPRGLIKLVCSKDYQYIQDFANVQVETY